jgi:TrmH family RNA methyltransferase
VIATVAAGGDDLYATALTGRLAIIVGNEGAGVTPALAAAADRRVSIPMPGAMESLNAAAAAAVCLFECVRQRAALTRGAAAREGPDTRAIAAGERRRGAVR